jgi:hypothetical protein
MYLSNSRIASSKFKSQRSLVLVGHNWLIQDALTLEQLLFLGSRLNDSISRNAKGSGLFVHLKTILLQCAVAEAHPDPRATPHCAFFTEL